jgi:MFS family permease
MSDPSASIEQTRPLFRHRPFRLLFTTRVAANTANQMQAVAVGWFIYELTGSALALGLIGLVQFLPPLCLTLLAGQVIDHHSRRLILNCCYLIELSVSLGLLVLASFADHPVRLVFALLLVNGIARTFETPTLQSLVASTVPRKALMQAVSAHASAGKMSQLAGPALGGLLYGFGPGIVFGLCAALVCAAGISSALLPMPPTPAQRPKITLATLAAGIRFIWNESAVLGAMSLDLVASLFGGVVALLPIFAGQILHINVLGFGLLRAAPATGAVIIAMFISHRPITRKAGRTMFTAVAVYGAATIGFGLSGRAVLSFALLLAVGAADMLSTVVRQSLIQFATPDEMRGRVFAVNTLFVNCATQLGMFESGVTAEWFGAVGSAVLGGAIVLIVVVIWARLFPSLRKVERPDDFAYDAVLDKANRSSRQTKA